MGPQVQGDRRRRVQLNPAPEAAPHQTGPRAPSSRSQTPVKPLSLFR